MRKTKFQTGEYYHIYNRGVDKRDVFMDEKDFLRFLRSMREFNRIDTIESLYRLNYIKKREGRETKEAKLPIGSLASCHASHHPLVDIICYSLVPNHHHMILKQLINQGIEKFLHKLNTGYTKYFNYKYDRSGSLFQGTYRDVHIDSNEYLVYLSAYINGNPEIHKISKTGEWPWSSYQDFLSLRNGTLCNKKIILDQFKNIADYKKYVNIIIKEAGQRKDELKQFLLE